MTASRTIGTKQDHMRTKTGKMQPGIFVTRIFYEVMRNQHDAVIAFA
jgi:hypothetical protein